MVQHVVQLASDSARRLWTGNWPGRHNPPRMRMEDFATWLVSHMFILQQLPDDVVDRLHNVLPNQKLIDLLKDKGYIGAIENFINGIGRIGLDNARELVKNLYSYNRVLGQLKEARDAAQVRAHAERNERRGWDGGRLVSQFGGRAGWGGGGLVNHFSGRGGRGGGESPDHFGGSSGRGGGGPPNQYSNRGGLGGGGPPDHFDGSGGRGGGGPPNQYSNRGGLGGGEPSTEYDRAGRDGHRQSHHNTFQRGRGFGESANQYDRGGWGGGGSPNQHGNHGGLGGGDSSNEYDHGGRGGRLFPFRGHR
jgi:hypothetical protein